MILSVHQPQYMPWLGYFDKIYRSDIFIFLDQVQYKEREFQNRNRIRTKEGWMWLTVPVISKGLGRQKISDVRVDNTLPWARKHWSSLKACYSKAAFFKTYSPFLEDLYARHWDRLSDLNVELTNYQLRELNIATKVFYESDIGDTQCSTARIIELCRKLQADTYLSGQGGKDYLEEGQFTTAGIKLVYQQFSCPRYRQVYQEAETDFIPNLAALDLLFNEGPESVKILKGER
jgi:hypothetical protein